jgi:hypothetical protein
MLFLHLFVDSVQQVHWWVHLWNAFDDFLVELAEWFFSDLQQQTTWSK